jgi:hypothetical protein
VLKSRNRPCGYYEPLVRERRYTSKWRWLLNAIFPESRL